MNVIITFAFVLYIQSINLILGGSPNPHTPNSLNLIFREYQVGVGGNDLDSYKRVNWFQS